MVLSQTSTSLMLISAVPLALGAVVGPAAEMIGQPSKFGVDIRADPSYVPTRYTSLIPVSLDCCLCSPVCAVLRDQKFQSRVRVYT